MNYEKRFNKIVEQIGDRDEIDGKKFSKSTIKEALRNHIE